MDGKTLTSVRIPFFLCWICFWNFFFLTKFCFRTTMDDEIGVSVTLAEILYKQGWNVAHPIAFITFKSYHTTSKKRPIAQLPNKKIGFVIFAPDPKLSGLGWVAYRFWPDSLKSASFCPDYLAPVPFLSWLSSIRTILYGCVNAYIFIRMPKNP